MIYKYNNFALSDLGDLMVSQTREYEGGDAPQRCKVTHRVTIELFGRSYDDNYALIKQANEALRTQQAVLLWQNEANNQTYVNQTATLASHDLPEEWGQYHQTLHLSFFYYEQDFVTQNLPLTFAAKGADGDPVNLQNVTKWNEGGVTERYSPLHSQRKLQKGKVSVGGYILGDPTLPLDQRRAALIAQEAVLKKQMTGAEGTLIFGAAPNLVFNQVVRVEEWESEVDQIICCIRYTFSATYTLFPNEADYALTEFSAEQRDPETGELFLKVSGKITAPDEAKARTAFGAFLAGVLKQYGYDTASQQLSCDTTASGVQADTDGAAFLELSFSGEWRKWRTDNQPANFQRTGGAQPVSLGNINRWNVQYSSRRYSELHSQRRYGGAVIEGGGTWAGDPTLPLDKRRAQLLAQQQAMLTEVNNADGKLAFGNWNQVVRIENFKADINQAITGIDWSFTASFTMFPNETNYALAEFSTEQRDPETGELFLKASGKIFAPDEAKSRAALGALLAGVLKQYGYDTNSQQLSCDTTASGVQADADGPAFLELSFTGEWKKWRADNQAANFQRTGGAQPVAFGNVNRWNVHYSARRYSELHSQRQRGGAMIEGSGTWAGDPALPLDKRRAQLLAQQRAMLAEVNNADGKLVFGDWNQVVRIESFKADINQSITGIDWSFTAAFTMFPDETNYALAEFTAELNDPNPNAGEQFLSVAGKITAQSEAAARAKMDAVMATVLAQYQFATASQKLNFRSTASTVSADADGQTFLELNFNGQWRKWCSTNQKATFQQSGKTGNAVDFGNVTKWNLRYAARRFTDLRSQREQAGGTIEASGTWAGDPALTLAQRRTQLLAQQQAMLAEVNNADGTLKYGAWSQIVRVADFKADINQAVTGIDWSFTAIWTLFPNEPGYATAEFSTDYQSNVETGDAMFTLEGRIFAPDETLADAELTRIRTVMLANYGFTLIQQLRAKATANRVYANGDKTAALGSFEDADGTTFTELTFSEEYRQRMANVLNDSLQIVTRDDSTTNQIITTYSGTVTASGDVDTAYALALQRAQTLGANKESTLGTNAFLRSSQIGWDQRRVQSGASSEFVRLTFAYEYQGRLAAGRAYIEVNTTTTQDTFGTDTQTVSGFVAATDLATAQQLYQIQVRSAYKTALIHNEAVTQSQLTANADAGSPKGQFLKLDFNFQLYQTKPTGRVAYRYGINVRRDFLTLKLETHIKGSIFAFNRVAANAALANLLQGLSGSQVTEELNEDREYMSDLASNATSDVFLKLDFDETYEDRLTGITGVLEMNLSQQVKYSGTRWIPQPLPFDANGSGGYTIVQPGGIQEGGQTIRGSVTAPDQTTATAWAKTQRSLLVGTYPQPEEWDWDYEFVPRIQGVVKGANPNVRLYKLTFTFAEILPNYPPPA